VLGNCPIEQAHNVRRAPNRIIPAYGAVITNQCAWFAGLPDSDPWPPCAVCQFPNSSFSVRAPSPQSRALLPARRPGRIDLSLQRTSTLPCDCRKHRPWRAWSVSKQHPPIRIAAQFPGRRILGLAFETVFPLCRALGGVKGTVSGIVQPTGYL